MTDNGPGNRSKIHANAVAKLQIKHLRTRPYRPRTNGKAERFIKTLQAEWAYAVSYQNHHQRAQALAPWLEYTTTTGGDHTAPSATSHPPAASPRLTNAPGIYI
jgi:transposase InsO family protein